jgi:hypothetical protein
MKPQQVPVQNASQSDSSTSTEVVEKRWVVVCWRLASLLLFLYVTILGANAIAEIQERQRIHDLIQHEISLLSIESNSDAKLEARRLEFENSLTQLRQLSAAGAIDSSYTLDSIRKALYPSHQKANYVKSTFGALGPILMPEFIDVSASARMYAFLIICASVIGAIVQYFRGDRHEPMKIVVTGVGAGIVCYLLIDSGNVGTFLPNSKSTWHPSTGILMGFLSGIFSNHIYSVIERSIKKLRS